MRLEYIVTSRKYWMMGNCTHCGVELKVGDRVISTRNKTVKRYHYDCAKELNIV